MVAAAAGKPVLLQELGYPSAPLLESSESEQAAFFTDAIPNSPELEAFLCSLGLRTVNGTPKAAWGSVTRAVRDAGIP